MRIVAAILGLLYILTSVRISLSSSSKKKKVGKDGTYSKRTNIIQLHLYVVLSTVVKFVETESRIVGLPCALVVKTFQYRG